MDGRYLIRRIHHVSVFPRFPPLEDSPSTQGEKDEAEDDGDEEILIVCRNPSYKARVQVVASAVPCLLRCRACRRRHDMLESRVRKQ